MLYSFVLISTKMVPDHIITVVVLHEELLTIVRYDL